MPPKFGTIGGGSNPSDNGQYSLRANGNGTGGWVFSWENSHPGHGTSIANKWRLKIGTAKYTWNVYPGSAAFVEINDNGTNINNDQNVRGLSTAYSSLYVCPEYQKLGETVWNSGQWTKFYPVT